MATHTTGAFGLGDSRKRAAKSSTMKGPEGLAGQNIQRRSRTEQASLSVGKGEPLVPAPRNHKTEQKSRANRTRAEASVCDG